MTHSEECMKRYPKCLCLTCKKDTEDITCCGERDCASTEGCEEYQPEAK